MNEKETCDICANISLKRMYDTSEVELTKCITKNEQLKQKVNGLKSELSIWKEDANEHIQEINKLFEENKQLKEEFNKLKHRHSLLHDDCIEAECDRDSYHKDVISLEKEYGRLKKKILEEIDLEIAYVDKIYSDDEMSKEQHNGAIISLRQLREKFE